MSNLPASGLIEKGVHHFPVRVYYDATDTGGIVYYAEYLKFAEQARTEMLRLWGVNQQALADTEGCFFVVRRVQIEYKASARLDDILVVESFVKESRGARLTMDQRIKKGEDTLVTLMVDIAFIHQEKGPQRIPDFLRQKAISEKGENNG